MITLSSHKTLLEKNVIKDLKRNKDEVEIEMIPSPSEEPKSAEPESFQKENVSNGWLPKVWRQKRTAQARKATR